jgi:hypothetical protein
MSDEELAEIEKRAEGAFAGETAFLPWPWNDRAALLAEVRRLRALPVIATCVGECRHAVTRHGAVEWFCNMAQRPLHDVDERAEPPPSWCPLRRGES